MKISLKRMIDGKAGEQEPDMRTLWLGPIF